MTDLTILHYTANKIPLHFADKVRQNIVEVSQGCPIISVSHEPINFGLNVCIGRHQPSTWWIYQQILIGAMLAETPYVACCEDDSLYTIEHLSFRPPLDTFAYNIHRYQANRRCYFYRGRAGMCMCIAPRDLLVSTLCTRFAKFPRPLSKPELTGFGEPGRKDNLLGLVRPKIMVFETKIPTITFNHHESMGGLRMRLASDIVYVDHPYWGPAKNLWRNIHG